MRTLKEVFKAFGSAAQMAAEVGATPSAVEKWKERRRIPSDAWSSVLAALRRRGHELSADHLLAMHDRERRSA